EMNGKIPKKRAIKESSKLQGVARQTRMRVENFLALDALGGVVHHIVSFRESVYLLGEIAGVERHLLNSREY
ncbi:hypothetical protein HAX54_044801, partial [Datura stramonium]|nr:hypothetical protein [Datura stramonium]